MDTKGCHRRWWRQCSIGIRKLGSIMHRYTCWNGAMPTTAALPAVATGTTIKTMLQIATPPTRQIIILAWGFTLDTHPGASSVFELIETDVAASVTAHV